MGTTAYGGKGQGKGKGRGEGQLGQGGRGRTQGGEKPMGTTAYGGKGSKGRAANGDRPVGAASCRRDHHTMVSCQTPPPPLLPNHPEVPTGILFQPLMTFPTPSKGWGTATGGLLASSPSQPPRLVRCQVHSVLHVRQCCGASFPKINYVDGFRAGHCLVAKHPRIWGGGWVRGCKTFVYRELASILGPP